MGQGSQDRERFSERLIPPIAAFFIRALRATCRVRVSGRSTIERFAANDSRYIHVFWHAHLLLMVYSYVGPRLVFMISQHRDGELIAKTVERFGYVPARGSSTRGGTAAWRVMLKAIRGGADIGFTPDGPRGPARKIQPGCIVAAQRTGLPIVPVAMGASRAWRLGTWDRFEIPQPGARVLLAYGDPLTVGRDEEVEQAASRLEAVMVDLEAFAGENASNRECGEALRSRRR